MVNHPNRSKQRSPNAVTYKVTLSNSGGELDSRSIDWVVGASGDCPIKAALLEMLDGIELYEGDTITVREAA